MFALIFDFLQAWNQLGLMIMALVFLLIGGGILADFFYWRLKGKRVTGRIAALRVKNRAALGPKRQSAPDAGARAKKAQEPLGEAFKKEPVATTFAGFIVLLFIGLPLAFSGFGVWMGYKYISLSAHGQWVQARVIDNEKHYDSESGTRYKAVLRFTDQSGRSREVKDTISYGGSPSYKRGTQIGIYYDPADPEKFVIDDFWHNMTIALLFFGFGIGFIGLIFLISYLNTRSSRTAEGTKKGKEPDYANEYYHPVYEYKARDGSRRAHTAGWGSNMLLGRLPGQSVDLLVIPGTDGAADRVRKKGVVGLIFGLIFFLPGLFIGKFALTGFAIRPATVLLILGIAGFAAYKVLSVLPKLKTIYREIKKEGLLEKENFKFTVTSSSPGIENERILENSEIEARLPGARAQMRIGGCVTLAIAIGLFIGAYYAGEDMRGRLENGVRVRGAVVDIESRYDSSSDGGGYTYYAMVEYVDANGKNIRFRDSVGSSHPMHKRGDSVGVLYDHGRPYEAIIDRGLLNWALSGGLGLGGLLLLYSTLYSFRLAGFGQAAFYAAGIGCPRELRDVYELALAFAEARVIVPKIIKNLEGAFDMLISKAYAQSTETAEIALAQAPSTTEALISTIGLPILLVILFYVLLIVPQQRRFKQHAAMLGELKKGDKVVTGGGLVGKIDKVVDEKEVVVDLGGGLKVTALRSTIQGKAEALLKPANDAAPEKTSKKK